MKNKTKKFSILFSFLLVLGIIFVLVFNNPFFISGVSALPVVVSPTLRPGENDDFEDDTIGTPPSELFYSYTGDYTVDNATASIATAHDYFTYMDTQSLNLSGEIGDGALFDFNESQYFSIDYYILMDSGCLRFIFKNSTTTSFELDYLYTFNATLYVNAYDLDDNGHVNDYDVGELYEHSGETGSPGWIKEDLNFDGLINYLDISYYVSHYVQTDTVNVYYVADIVYEGLTYHYSSLLYSFVPRYYEDDTYMLHSYLQFSLRNDSYTSFSCAFRGDGGGSTSWSSTEVRLIGNCVWDRLNISCEADTVAYLDGLSVCYTPYQISPHSYSPAMDSNVDLTGLEVPISVSYNLGNNGNVPMFVDMVPYIYAEVGSTTQTSVFQCNYDGFYTKSNSDYTTAVQANSADDFDDDQTSLFIGQFKDTSWHVYRTLLSFPTASLPNDAVIDNAVISVSPSYNPHGLDFVANLDKDFDYPWVPLVPAPIGETAYGAYDQDKYDMHELSGYLPSVVIENKTYINKNGDTRCILRGVEAYSSAPEAYEDAILIVNSSEASNGYPTLTVTYHIPVYSWVPAGYYEEGSLIRNNATYSLEVYPSFDFSTDYYWYMNVTTADFYTDIPGYSWEFPQSGTIKGDKYCYHFTTNDYKPPYVSAWSPAHNSVNQPFGTTLNVTVNNHYGGYGQYNFYILNNVSHVWVSSGSGSYSNGDVISISIPSFTYNKDIYWCVALEDWVHPGYEYYPNVTQSGMYLYGNKAWKTTTEFNNPPVVKSFSPANNSKINPWLDTIYINMSSMNAGEHLSFSFFIIENEQWYNASRSPPIYYEDTISMLVNNNSRLDGVGCGTGHKYYTPVNGSINFTWTPQDMVDVGYLYPRNNTCFSWRVVMFDEENTVYYPLTGRLFEGLKWINYTVDLEQGNKLPTVTINYPLGGSYTKGQWRKNHDLSVTLNDLEGDNIRLLMTVRSGDVDYVNNLMLDPSGSYLNTAFNPYITPYFANGTYIIDLSPYIPFDNTEYVIIITATDDYIYHYGLSGNTAYVALEIGTPPGKQYHLAFMGFNPPNGELNGVSATSQVTGYLALNKMSSPPKYASGDGYQIAVFFADGNVVNSDVTGNSVGYNLHQLLLSGKGTKWRWGWTTTSKILINPITGMPYVDFNIVAGDFPLPTAQYFTSLNIKDNDTITPWTKISLTPSLASRHPYKMWIGLYTGLTFSGIGTSTDIYGNEFANYQIFPEDEIEIDNLYDDSLASCPDFRFDSYVLQNVYMNARHIATPPYKFGEGDYNFGGMSSDFSTYNTYDNPELFVYNLDIPNVIEDAGIGFGGIIIALLIIGLSAICPYILIKRKARSVPMPIIASFTLFGFILSYGMGLIPIYAFVIVLFIIFIMIIYKAIAYITGKVQNASDDGVKK